MRRCRDKINPLSKNIPDSHATNKTRKGNYADTTKNININSVNNLFMGYKKFKKVHYSVSFHMLKKSLLITILESEQR